VSGAERKPGTALKVGTAVRAFAAGSVVLALACGSARLAPGPCGDLSSIPAASGSPAPLTVSNVDVGATGGPITISGHLTDSSGNPIVGGRVDLAGDATAVRFTNFTGGFAFHVDSGAYTLSAGGDCSFAFTPVSIGNVAADVTHDFQAMGEGCTSVVPGSANPHGIMLPMARNGGSVGTSIANIEDRCPGTAPCCDLTIARLQQIESEQPSAPAAWLTIAGYPAIEREVELTADPPLCEGCGGSPTPYLAVTTAIALQEQIVRFESQLPEPAAASDVALLLAAGRAFTPAELPELHGPPYP
jgi:hypothetical protein